MSAAWLWRGRVLRPLSRVSDAADPAGGLTLELLHPRGRVVPVEVALVSGSVEFRYRDWRVGLIDSRVLRDWLLTRPVPLPMPGIRMRALGPQGIGVLFDAKVPQAPTSECFLTERVTSRLIAVIGP